MRESRRRWKGCSPWHHDSSAPPNSTHRESHGDSLNFYSHPTNGMKISPTEVFGENWEGKKKKKKKKEREKEREKMKHKCHVKGGPQRKPPLIKWEQECY